MLDNVKGIIFDLDGTLFDSNQMWHEIDINFFKKRGMEVPENFSEKIAPLGLEKAALYCINECGITSSKEDIINEWHQMAIDEYTYNVNLKPFAKEYIIKLKEKGIKLAIATANDDKFYMPCLKRNNIDHYFDYICDVNEFKGTKNNPQIYLHAASKLGLVPSQIAVFEDVLRAIKSAKEGGFYTIAVDDESSKNLRNEKALIADRFIYSFEELL